MALAWVGERALADPPEGASVAKVDDAKIKFFENRVRPLLVDHCYECHSEEAGETSGDLRLDNAAAMLRGGITGPTIVPGKVEASLMVQVIRYDGELQMPPEGKLSDEAIQTLEHWVAIGAPDPRQGTAGEPEASPLSRDPQSHWAFQIPRRTPPPSLDRTNDHMAAGRDAIDDHAAAAAIGRGLAINPIADDETLIRRLYFDLNGMPPTQAQIAAFVQSDRVDKYARLVDRLLASPEFGERMGRHWLDVARYADTLGYTLAGRERRFEGSERYRDWVIRAFARDMPYPQMIHHQLAGDRTDPDNQEGNLDAMGFLTLGRRFLNPLDVTDDRIDVISRGLLGLTVSCARCHDHKFDPIPTKDYYALFGVLRSSRTIDDGASPLMMVDAEKPSDQRVMVRGQPGNRGEIAPRQFLTALRRPDEPRFRDGSGRLELAHRITSDDNPLYARVMVNRLWKILIGKPLVDSPSDFGFRTQPPAVPEILDDLASEFAGDGSVQRVVRRIVMTRIYRQSASVSEAVQAADSENRWLTRANRRRRDFESLRDSMMACGDFLDHQVGGASVEIAGSFVAPRRTVYATIDRQNLPALFRTFDFASPDTHSPGRYLTTVPQQGLYLLNSGQVYFLAQRIAAEVRRSAGGDRRRQVESVVQRVLSRSPNDEERERMIEFLQQPATPFETPIDPRTLWSYGQGRMETERNRIEDFEPLGTFSKGVYQAEEKFPAQGEIGFASLSAEGGHPPRASNRAVVRRFTVPFDGRVTIRGQYGHRSRQGDGVHLDVWVGDQRVFSKGAKSNNTPMPPLKRRVKAGQVIDFSVSNQKDDRFDGFDWRVTVSLVGDDDRKIDSESEKDFYGGPPLKSEGQRLGRLAQLAQVLLWSNEFAFVD